MVRQCYLCKVYNYHAESLDLSFHRLPINREKRNIWISALGFNEDHKFPKQVEICSNHFQKSDFQYRLDGTKYLKQHAVPLRIHSPVNSVESTSSDSTFGDSPLNHEQTSICVKTEEESEDGTVNPVSSSFEDTLDKKCVPGPEEADYLIPKEEPMSPLSEDVQEKITIVVEENSIKIESTDEVVAASHLPFNQIGKLEVANTEIKREYDSSSPTLDTTPTLKNLCPSNPPQQSLPRSPPPLNTAAGREPPSRRSSSSSRTLTCSSPSRTLTCSPPSRLSSMQDSESEHEMEVESACRNVLGHMRNGRNRRRSYLGDYTDKDFDDPVVAKQALSLAMAKIAQQRKQIKVLQTERRRLNARVKYLKGLIKELQQREMDLMDW